MRLIFGKDNDFYELVVKSGGYTLKTPKKTLWDKFSILKSVQDGNAHKVVSFCI